MKSDTSRELKSVNDLIGTPFVVVSEDFMKLVVGEMRKAAGLSEEDERDWLIKLFLRAKTEVRFQGRKLGAVQHELRNLKREMNNKQQAKSGAKSQGATRIGQSPHDLLVEERRKVRELEAENRKLTSHAKTLEQRSKNLSNQSESLKKQIQAIQSSRTWTMLDRLKRLSAGLSGAKK